MPLFAWAIIPFKISDSSISSLLVCSCFSKDLLISFIIEVKLKITLKSIKAFCTVNLSICINAGAVDEKGQMPYYAEECASMLAVTFSSGSVGKRNIVTTDWTLDSGTGCTTTHTGTSAAAPLAAGMIALMLEAKECLSWRDVQHIIVYTSVKVS